MQTREVRRLVFKFAVLILMIGALFAYRSDTRAQYGSPNCDGDYQYCTSICGDQYFPGSDEYYNCVHGYSGCDADYFTCWDAANPPRLQPQLPCPPCLAQCDLEQQQCVAEGYSVFTCASVGVKCRNRCNYSCYY